MGGVAGATGARSDPLTRWAFAPDDVERGVGERNALVLPPDIIARLPPLRSAALTDAVAGGARSVRRRLVLAALVGRSLPSADPVALVVDADGRRRLAGTAFYASVSERAGWAGAVLSHTPAGIDLEAVSEADLSATAILDGIDAVDPADWHGFAGIWAAREATLKAMGRDLTGDPRGWRFGRGIVAATGCPAYCIDLTALPGIVAAVAYAGG